MLRSTKAMLTGVLLGALTVGVAAAETVTFDLDSATPILSIGQALPLDQTSGWLAASFSGGFSVQDAGSTGFYLTMLQGKYLYPNAAGAVLEITFARPVTTLAMVFATADSHQAEIPTTIRLTAWLGSKASAPVGTVSGHATYGNATFPEGTLTFAAGGQPFNVVEIDIPPQPAAASGFLVDAITVTTVPHVPRRHLLRTGH
jgi:hypothetical protein